jgi:hypothetical protein
MRFFAFLLFAARVSCQTCPWLNSATAAGVLGGAVQLKTTATACEFVREQAHAAYRLHIEVVTMTARNGFESYLSHCGRHRTPIKAMGNEAFACPAERAIIGRVRNQVFDVRLSVPRHSSAPDVLEENTRKIAEQVAGALF